MQLENSLVIDVSVENKHAFTQQVKENRTES
jgi:hypothetical protein